MQDEKVKREILHPKIGSRYLVKRQGKFMELELVEIETYAAHIAGGRNRTRYICVNLKTNRRVVLKSSRQILSVLSIPINSIGYPEAQQ